MRLSRQARGLLFALGLLLLILFLIWWISPG
jgi:hypothetical protein